MTVVVPESVMALEIVSPSELEVKGEPDAEDVVIEALLKASVPPEIVKNWFWPVPPTFVNDIESIETVPTSLTVVVRVLPPNTSEYVVPDVDAVGAFTEGFQFAVVPQLKLLEPFHDAIVPADRVHGVVAAAIPAIKPQHASRNEAKEKLVDGMLE